jgi:hypothetical protein
MRAMGLDLRQEPVHRHIQKLRHRSHIELAGFGRRLDIGTGQRPKAMAVAYADEDAPRAEKLYTRFVMQDCLDVAPRQRGSKQLGHR